MLLVDRMLSSPFRGIMAILREIHKAAEQELADQGRATRTELSELYLSLEHGDISEQEFDAREKQLLERLDELEPPDGDGEEGFN